MDLYVCGNSPLIQPAPCRRYFSDRPNECNHVSSGQVDTSGPDKACPLMATAPVLVLSGLKQITIRTTGAENTLHIEDDSGTRIIHCRDSHDRSIEEATLTKLREHVRDEDQQELWIDPKFKMYEDEDDLADDLFGSDYPRGPTVGLGLLSRSGAIYSINQDPFGLQEVTNDENRTPFSHAIFRQECNNGQLDPWLSVVLPQRPCELYWSETTERLLRWRQGEQMVMRSSHFPSPIAHLLASRGRAEYCVATFEDGKVFFWPRDQNFASKANLENEQSPNQAAIGYLDIPPTEKVALGLSLGAAVTRDGELYVFSLRLSTERDAHTPHIADLDDGTPQHRMPKPLEPRLASINTEGVRFVDVAAGDEHLVALTADGRVFTVGNGFQGALGIGQRQFQLDNNDTRSFEWSHEATQFAEDWQEVHLNTADNGKGSKVVKVGAGYQSTIMITSSN